MKLFLVLLSCTFFLPLITNGLHLNVDLGILNGLLNNLFPPLNLGIRVDLLISLSTVLDILLRPFDANHAITACSSPGPNVNASLLRNGLSSTSGLWYQSEDKKSYYVPIVMDPAFTADEKNTIYTGMIEIQQKTCVKFYIYNEPDLNGFDYVKIIRGSGKGCYSEFIGRAHRGRQIVNLQPMEPSGCIIAGIAEHELLHAIGFDHEQCTPGRDNYVTIMKDNIQDDKLHNFVEDSASKFTSFGAPYDYGSVMHYDAYAFSKNNQKTIIVKQNGAQIGQRKGLSNWDAYKVNKMHSCPA